MSQKLQGDNKTMGTMPVFMTAISTILGAILFLKFGYALGHVGLLYTLLIIVIGHMVTIPTAMAVAEIATNQKVEGGGAYYIISRSFGLNIGGAIGIALFLAQAISIAFYIIAFGESLEIVRIWVMEKYGWEIFVPTITMTTMAILAVLILTKGANLGMKALYFVVAILIISLTFFFLGSTGYNPQEYDIFGHIGADYAHGDKKGPDDFFYVFAIIFPAFTGIAAGLGLSGDLKEPRKSIPRGTIWATAAGIVIYVAVAFKLFYSASPEQLADEENLVMANIAIWGPIIPIGLACAAISSALGSIMIAPRTLQALGSDKVLPGEKVNSWLGKGRKKDNEPINASVITVAIAFAFLMLQDINAVAEIISMFFMVTYGAICMVSFFEHFAADPSYRPTFRSRWYVSLIGGALCFWLMFQMNAAYAIGSIALMVGIYIWISSVKKDSAGLANLFKGVIFQLSRSLQVFLQRRESDAVEDNWRPFIITLSENSFKRTGALKMTSWISYKYGFGTYLHLLRDRYSPLSKTESDENKSRLIKQLGGEKSRVYLDTMVSPDYASAMAQSAQMKGVSGQDNNMMLLEFSSEESDSYDYIFDQYNVLKTSGFDLCVLRTNNKGFGYQKSIHIWITTADFVNSNLMILLGYIIFGHPEWKKAEIKIFSLFTTGNYQEKQQQLHELITAGRLPISLNNVQLIQQDSDENSKQVINEYSTDADLTILGFDDPDIDKYGKELFNDFDNLGNILFVNASEEKEIH